MSQLYLNGKNLHMKGKHLVPISKFPFGLRCSSRLTESSFFFLQNENNGHELNRVRTTSNIFVEATGFNFSCFKVSYVCGKYEKPK